MTKYTEQEKANYLAKIIDEKVKHTSGNTYEAESGAEYLILTDAEADELAREEIGRSLWAFNADFILEHAHKSDELTSFEWLAGIESIKKAQAEQCEDFNGIARCLVGNLEQFASDAISADGRGHFLATYDGEEIEMDGPGLFAYRVD